MPSSNTLPSEPLTIYQKPTCSTCRGVMSRLRDMGFDYNAINYIIDPPSRSELARLVAAMGVSPRDILRTKEPEYRELGLGSHDIDDERLLDEMVSHPILIQRPIISWGDHALLARPAERVEEIREWGIVTGRL